MTSNRARALVVSGLVGGGLVLAAAPAHAADPPPPRGKERCTTAIDRRLTTLRQLAERARSSGPLTDPHEATITATTTQQAQGLTALRAEVQAATTAAAVAEPCRRVVPEYRVYVLTRPKVHITIAADTVTAATARLDEAIAKLQQAADAAGAAGGDVTAAQAEIDSAKAGAQAARNLVAGVPDTVLVLQPAGYPGNATVLSSSRSTVTEARGRLHAAAQDAKDARVLIALLLP